MQLLVSVSNHDEARAALAGGADIIDAKDPNAGALGAVSLDVFREIAGTVGNTRPVSAALGDAIDDAAIEGLARDYASAGAAFVKVGFDTIDDASRVRSLVAAAVSGVRRERPYAFHPKDRPFGRAVVIAVVYADRTAASTRDRFIDMAAAAGAAGVLIDTAAKNASGLRRLIDTDSLSRWIARAHDAGLIAAVAGRLTIDDLPWVHLCGADVAGVRGAACESGRTTRVSADNVRLLHASATAPIATPV